MTGSNYEYQGPIDFGIGRGHSGGLYVELAPGGELAALDHVVHIEDRAFYMFSHFIRATPGGEGFDIYGHCRLTYVVWFSAVEKMKQFVQQFDQVSSPSEINWYGASYEELDEAFLFDFDRSRSGLGLLTSELENLTLKWYEVYEYIYIFGV